MVVLVCAIDYIKPIYSATFSSGIQAETGNFLQFIGHTMQRFQWNTQQVSKLEIPLCLKGSKQ